MITRDRIILLIVMIALGSLIIFAIIAPLTGWFNLNPSEGRESERIVYNDKLLGSMRTCLYEYFFPSVGDMFNYTIPDEVLITPIDQSIVKCEYSTSEDFFIKVNCSDLSPYGFLKEEYEKNCSDVASGELSNGPIT